MATDIILLQYPEETIRVNNYHNVVVPTTGDVYNHGGKKYKVDYRIFDPENKTVAIIFIEI